jgi:cobaltochelatase CobT
LILLPYCVSPESFEHALEVTCRTIAGDAGLPVMIGSREKAGIEDPGPLRGLFDEAAFRKLHHDAQMHRLTMPAGPISAAIFDQLENLRIEAMAARSMCGAAANLDALFGHHYRMRGLNVLGSDEATPLANAVVLLARNQLLDTPLPVSAQRMIRRWKPEINMLTGGDFESVFTHLAMTITDQRAFARLSRQLITNLELRDDPEQGNHAKPAEIPPDELEAEETSEQGDLESGLGDSEGRESIDTGSILTADDQHENEQGESEYGEGETANGADPTVIPFPQEKQAEPAVKPPDSDKGLPEEPADADGREGRSADYHAYTCRFDEELHARDIVGKDRMIQLRAELDQAISEHRRIAARLANRLQRSLATLQKRTWTFDLDDGLLNTRRLPRLVIDPVSPLAYMQEKDSETRDTIVSFLIDNSGSMRGQPITLAAMFADILAQALERCRVGTEILGFTTGQWRGGHTRKLWQANGSPGNPGRLSDLRHIIYKAADEPWRRARQTLGVMLWPELRKENIDGEALVWAHRRLSQRSEKRRVLVVITDGVPADDATLSANAADYLDAHLHQVVRWIETRSTVELIGIGIGHDINSIYQRSVTIADSEQLGEAIAHELVELLGNIPTVARHPFTQNFKPPISAGTRA